MPTFVAYIYDAKNGLAKRTVVSDDYATEKALKDAHCIKDEDALITTYPGTIEQNKVTMAIAVLSEDQQQDAITAHCKITPPAKLKYALRGPTGKVFEVIETRRPDDIRLKFHQDFEQTKNISAGDLSAAQAIVAQYPDLALMQKDAITPKIQAAHNIVSKAKDYGIVADSVARLDPVVTTITKEADQAVTLSGFDVYKSDDVKVGDKIEADGKVSKVVIAPVDANVIEGDPEIVL